MEKDSTEIRREIEETRERMGDTVEALAFKADVPARAKDAVDDQVDTVKHAVADAVDTTQSTVGSVVESLQSKVTDVVGQAAPHIANARDTVGDALPTGDDARAALDGTSRFLRQKPVALSGIAAIAVVLGSLLTVWLRKRNAPETEVPAVPTAVTPPSIGLIETVPAPAVGADTTIGMSGEPDTAL